ncbi:trimethylguanosine synthase-like isoform X2 [Daktulosphaira vitifoliae]|nr:trimethylguanosine synthase-like isoform X2 [Daktulosphaira vitifoliae]
MDSKSTLIASPNTTPILPDISTTGRKFTDASAQTIAVETEKNIFSNNNTTDNSFETDLPNNDIADTDSLCQLHNAIEEKNISTQICNSAETTQLHTPESAFNDSTAPIKLNYNTNSSNNTRPRDVPKYLWDKRHFLFTKFDNGILLDCESFYCVCPEILSKHISKRCKGHNVAMNPFCGVGGNAIQLAMKYEKVIAIDIDPKKLEFAKKNAEIYGVRDKIKFIMGDFFAIANDLKKYKPEIIVTSTPWGEPSYINHRIYNSKKNMCTDYEKGGRAILKLARRIAPNVAMHLPKSTRRNELYKLGKYFNNNIEIQKNFINRKLDSITAYFGKFYNMNAYYTQTDIRLFNRNK